MLFRNLTLLLLFMLITNALPAQKKIRVQASGSYVSHDMTPEQTKQKAIEEAKKDAMKKAGISEKVSMTDFLYQFEDNERFQEIFQAFTSTEIGAEIIVDSILSVTKDFNSFGNMLVEVEIMATVFKHKTREDPAFNFTVSGINKYYNNGDLMKFTFQPSTDGYLKIFNITDTHSSLLYPYREAENPYLNDQLSFVFEKRNKYVFPMNQAFDQGYSVEIDDPEKEEEFNLLIFVYTKEDIPFFSESPEIKYIMEWIYDIPPDQRKLKQNGFVIQR